MTTDQVACRRTRSLAGAALLIVAAAGPVHAQNCIWNVFQVGLPWSYGGDTAFNTVTGRTLWVAPGDAPNPAVWAWDGAAWTAVGSTTSVRRTGFRVAFDSARARLVLFGGGVGSTYLTDTWEWDGGSWTRIATSGPPGRGSHVMVYDEQRHRTVLFGGYTSTVSFHDTWEWDGSAWTLSGAVGPISALNHCFAYDSLRGRSLLLARNASHQELWEWDGLAWTARPDPPQGAQPYWMAYDRGRARMIVSRENYSSTYGRLDTLEFDPAAPAVWTVRTPGTGSEGFAAYDPIRARTVVPGYWTLEFDGAGTVVPPAVIVQPQSSGTRPGVTIVLSAGVAGTLLDMQWSKDGVTLHDDGRISGSTTPTLTILNGDAADDGSYALRIANACGSEDSDSADVWVGIPPCYANCDGSTVPPVLNVGDFICFLNKFAAGDSYADCDGSSVMPRFNVNDFICFQVKFMQGCP